MEGDGVTPPPDSTDLPKTRSEWFDYLCPIYMSYGMSYEDYWHGDNSAPKHYRKAYELKRKENNFDLWLQGYYFYEALASCAPILNALSKSKEPLEYRKYPVPLTQAEIREERDRKEREAILRNREAMRLAAEKWNAEFKRKSGGEDG